MRALVAERDKRLPRRLRFKNLASLKGVGERVWVLAKPTMGLGCCFDKSGYIDKTGRTIIQVQFAAGGPFKEGLAGVSVNGKWRYIDKKSQSVVPAQYGRAAPFSEGLAAVTIAGKFGFIDKTGKVAIPPKYNIVLPFAEGLAVVKLGKKWGPLIKKRGR